MIGTVKRTRPIFNKADLRLRDKTDDLVFLPSEFVPHTITANFAATGVCIIEFEYQIDEDIGITEKPYVGVSIKLGKYTNKVLGISLEFSNSGDFLDKISKASAFLETRKISLRLDSHRRNYKLVLDGLKVLINQIMHSNVEALFGEI